MKRHHRIGRLCFALCLGLGLVGFSTGLDCLGGGPGAAPLEPPVPAGNRPPRVQFTSIITESNDMFAEQGESVLIAFTGEDGEDQATVRIFASQTQAQPGQQIPIAEGILIGPGTGSDEAAWDTAGVTIGVYYLFAEIDDGVNDPVLVTAGGSVQVAPPGSRPQNVPPDVVILTPLSNLGLSSQDEVSIIYAYTDRDDAPTLILLLDKDRNPTNDDIRNPGDPFDPNSNIIILPSEPRRTTDPTFDGDPPPPDDPNNPPGAVDSIEIRTNPRVLGQTAGNIAEFKEYRFNIDFSKIPVRKEPYFLRATIQDERHTVHAYAIGSITITQLANGVVDVGEIGFSLAGARWHGFSAGENLGSDLIGIPDIDGDGMDELLIASRFGSPKNRSFAGAAYLIFGRPKLPFPLDTNGNGLPDVLDGNGNVIDFPAPPTYVPNPYLSINVGRFGGEQSINSVASFFRGTTIGMPEPHGTGIPPADLQDPEHPGVNTAGLTSITRLDMTGDGVPDFVFGLPFISRALQYQDDDLVDGGCDLPYGDAYPSQDFCDRVPGNDDIDSYFDGEPIDQGYVIVVDGTNDIASTFPLFVDACMAGQFDPGGAVDDEGLHLTTATTPNGFRFRGGWFDTDPPIVSDNQFGRFVSTLPSIDYDTDPELLISMPGFDGGRGRVLLWFSADYDDAIPPPVHSFPAYADFGCSAGTPSICLRGFWATPVFSIIDGADAGDGFGSYVNPAGFFNQDGPSDVMFGAPGASRPSLNDPGGPALNQNGVLYILFTPAGGFGDTDLSLENPPRVEIIGTHDGDRFGESQTSLGDMNGDGIGDIAFASQSFDDDVLGNADAGYVGVIFGNRPLTGENGFSPDDVGTPALSGVRFFGPTIGARAGHDIDSAGDFNRDGYGDLLISCPGERRDVNVGDINGDGIDDIETRLGVAYLIFGGTHLINKTFNLSDVGNPTLPGMVLISRFALGSENQAELETVGGLGDIDGDGFDDIAVGAPKADFVNLSSPNQRRNDAGEFYIIYGNNFGSNDLGG